MVNFRERYLESKGFRAYRLEDPPQAMLRPLVTWRKARRTMFHDIAETVSVYPVAPGDVRHTMEKLVRMMMMNVEISCGELQ